MEKLNLLKIIKVSAIGFLGLALFYPWVGILFGTSSINDFWFWFGFGGFVIYMPAFFLFLYLLSSFSNKEIQIDKIEKDVKLKKVYEPATVLDGIIVSSIVIWFIYGLQFFFFEFRSNLFEIFISILMVPVFYKSMVRLLKHFKVIG